MWVCGDLQETGSKTYMSVHCVMSIDAKADMTAAPPNTKPAANPDATSEKELLGFFLGGSSDGSSVAGDGASVCLMVSSIDTAGLS